jgi:hypothetical protein
MPSKNVYMHEITDPLAAELGADAAHVIRAPAFETHRARSAERPAALHLS